MYSKLELGIHGLISIFLLPLLYLKDKIYGFTPNKTLQREDLRGFVCVVTGIGS